VRADGANWTPDTAAGAIWRDDSMNRICRIAKMALGLATLGGVVAGVGAPQARAQITSGGSLDSIAEAYVQLMRSPPPSRRETDELIRQLDQLDATSYDEIERLRHGYLHAELSSVRWELDISSGQPMSYEERCLALSGLRVRQYDRSYFETRATAAAALVPGEGDIAERVSRFVSNFMIPQDKLEAVFTRTLAEARRRTRQHIQLRDDGGVELQFESTDAYQTDVSFLPNGKTLLKVSTHWPLDMTLAINFVCHEGYPGHHVHLAVQKEQMLEDRGWIEHDSSLGRWESPFNAVAEGAAEYATELTFPMQDRVALGKELAALAGLDPTGMAQYIELSEILWELRFSAFSAVGRDYLDGVIDRDVATERLAEFTLISTEEAAARMRVVESLGSRAALYSAGRRLVADHIGQRVGAEDGSQERWNLYYRILSTPQTPSSLGQLGGVCTMAPNVLLAGRSTPLDVSLVLDGPREGGGYPEQILVDLSYVDGSSQIPLQHLGGGSYVGSTMMGPSRNGRYPLPVVMEAVGNRRELLLIDALEVYPDGDLVIVDDALRQDWRAEGANGAELLMATGDGPVYDGEAALALAVESASFLGWKVDLLPLRPVHPFGYTHLSFAFHPGTLEGAALNLNVGARGVKLVASRGTSLVDLQNKEWRRVIIDLDEIGVGEPIDRINLNGTVEGAFYLDDLRLVAREAQPAVTAVGEALVASLPRALTLSQNYPNPFNSSTAIRFGLPQPEMVSLTIYNLAGQEVATLVQGQLQTGSHTLRWDGRGEDGRELASGVYLCRLEAGDQVAMRKLVLVR